MTTTIDTNARDLRAGDMILFRSTFRTVLADPKLDLTDDGEAFVNLPLEALPGQPLNAWLLADQAVPVVR